jgi:hypothetical protein
MIETTPSTLQRLLADEFTRRGWRYDLSVARDLLGEIEKSGAIEPAVLAGKVSTTFLEANVVTRAAIADAIGNALAGRTLVAEAPSTLIINDHRYSLHIGAGAQVSQSSLNVAGNQIVIHASSSRDELTAAVAALVRTGLAGTWNPDAARELARVVDSRSDVTFEDVDALVRETAESEKPDARQIRSLLSAVATNALGGVLGTGLASGLGHVLALLPNLSL